MDLAVQVPVPADEQVHPWPGDLCRRCRASGLAVRRPRRQFRARGRRESGVEARSRAAGNVARDAAGELPYRTQCGGRREHPRIHALDRLHGAQFAPGGAAAQGGAVARQGNRVRQAHGECGAALDALDLRNAALDRRWRFVARRPASRRVDGGCAGCRPGRRADVPDRCLHRRRNAVHGAGVWQWCGRGSARRGGRDPHWRRRLCRCRRACRRALRRRTRHRLFVAPRRLCRGAVPASDPRRGSTPRWRVPQATTEVSS